VRLGRPEERWYLKRMFYAVGVPTARTHISLIVLEGITLRIGKD